MQIFILLQNYFHPEFIDGLISTSCRAYLNFFSKITSGILVGFHFVSAVIPIWNYSEISGWILAGIQRKFPTKYELTAGNPICFTAEILGAISSLFSLGKLLIVLLYLVMS